MEALWMFAVARPWHYWLGVGLLGTGLVLLLAIAVGYYRKVLVPLYERRMMELRPPASTRQLAAAPTEGGRRLGTFPSARAA